MKLVEAFLNFIGTIWVPDELRNIVVRMKIRGKHARWREAAAGLSLHVVTLTSLSVRLHCCSPHIYGVYVVWQSMLFVTLSCQLLACPAQNQLGEDADRSPCIYFAWGCQDLSVRKWVNVGWKVLILWDNNTQLGPVIIYMVVMLIWKRGLRLKGRIMIRKKKHIKGD